MSIRIYNDGLAGTAASETSRAQEATRASGSGKSAGGSGAVGEDQVQISSLSEAITAQSSQRAAFVQNLAAVYQSGRYQASPAAVGQALVDQALSAGSMESSQ
jgi:hypothetical protein